MGDFSFEKVEEKVIFNLVDKININIVLKMLLEVIKGIGLIIVSRIILYREEYGLFERVEDIVFVNGVSNKFLEKIVL